MALFLADADGGEPLLPDELPPGAAFGAPQPVLERKGPLRDMFGDADDLAKQRWSVVVPQGEAGAALLAAVAPLVALRAQEQKAEVVPIALPSGMDRAASVAWREDVYLDGEEEDQPRYLMLLGGFDHVSAAFEQVMAQTALVGRLCFTTPEGAPDLAAYAAYARKACDAESAARTAAPNPPDALFFTAGDGTRANVLGRAQLASPCIAEARKWQSRGRVREVSEIAADITEPRDLAAATRTARPGILLTVSHGLGPPARGWSSAAERRARQGALKLARRADGTFAAIDADAVRAAPFLPFGLWFCFACFGAGTPIESDYHAWLSLLAERGQCPRPAVARALEALPSLEEGAFVAAMPQAALASPEGPLAFIGHMDLAWSYSFVDPTDSGRSRASRISSALAEATRGRRAGVVLDKLYLRYRDANDGLAADYQAEQSALASGKTPEVDAIARANLWMLRNDLKNFVLLGDPAARLPGVAT